MKNFKNWMSTFDTLNNTNVKPFEKHIVADLLSAHEKNIYTSLHTAFLLFNGSITDEQERLYQFWLSAISEGLCLSDVIGQAQDLHSEKLKEAVELVKEKDLFVHLLLDILVFCRLDGGLSHELKQILNEWCQYLAVEQAVITDVVTISDHILGIDNEAPIKATDTVIKVIANPIWSEFYMQELTKEMLPNVKNGVWRLSENLEDVSGDIVIENAIVVFNNASSIQCSSVTLKISESNLINPIFNCASLDLDISNSSLSGNYPENNETTVIDAKIVKSSNVKNSVFNTVNARTFNYTNNENTTPSFGNVTFEKCGNKMILGGVIYHKSNVKFNQCQFINCNALVGGAIFGVSLNVKVITSCKFINCHSAVIIDNEDLGAIYYDDESKYSNIIDSEIDSNVTVRYLRSIHNNGSCQLLTNCYFKGFILYKSDHGNNPLDSKTMELSGFTSSDERNKKLSALDDLYKLVNEHKAGANNA